MAHAHNSPLSLHPWTSQARSAVQLSSAICGGRAWLGGVALPPSSNLAAAEAGLGRSQSRQVDLEPQHQTVHTYMLQHGHMSTVLPTYQLTYLLASEARTRLGKPFQKKQRLNWCITD